MEQQLSGANSRERTSYALIDMADIEILQKECTRPTRMDTALPQVPIPVVEACMVVLTVTVCFSLLRFKARRLKQT